MNRDELKARYKTFLEKEGVTSEEAIVGAGGALLLLGFREETEDVDLSVYGETFARLAKSVEKQFTFSSGDREVLVLEWGMDIDVHGPEEAGCSTVLVEGVRCWTAEYVLQFKRRLNRPKDQPDIARLEAALGVKGG